MSHGKRWQVRLSVIAGPRHCESIEMNEWTVIRWCDDYYDSLESLAADVASTLAKTWPNAIVVSCRIGMECRTCGFEAPDGGPYKCKCDGGEHAP